MIFYDNNRNVLKELYECEKLVHSCIDPFFIVYLFKYTYFY